MRLQINGQFQDLEAVTTVAELLIALGENRELTAKRKIAVELNGEIVPRSAYDARAIKEGDCLEIVQAVGGG